MINKFLQVIPFILILLFSFLIPLENLSCSAFNFLAKSFLHLIFHYEFLYEACRVCNFVQRVRCYEAISFNEGFLLFYIIRILGYYFHYVLFINLKVNY